MDENRELRTTSFLNGSVGHQLRCTQIALNKRYYELFNDFGLTTIQIAILIRLSEMGDMTQRALGADVSVSPSILVRLLKELEKDGFIRRKRPPEDLRTQHIELTSKGKQKAKNAKTLIMKVEKKLSSVLSPQEKSDLLNALHKIRDC